MASNQKLTKLIAGRAIASSVQAEGLLTVTFADGSTMKVKTASASAVAPAGTAPTVPTPGASALAPPAPTAAPATSQKVKKVRQKGCELNLDLEDGSTVCIHTVEATASVMLRDHAGKLEYAD